MGLLFVVDIVLVNYVEVVLWEVVSNVVWYVNVISLVINVSVEDDVWVEVVDDGVGIFGDIIESGLCNFC